MIKISTINQQNQFIMQYISKIKVFDHVSHPM